MKKVIMVIIAVLILISSTGCTKYVNDNNKKIVTFEKTGQSLTANLLCKPTDKELLKLYEKYDDKLLVKMDKLPACKDFKINSLKYVSIWESIFVKPLAYVILLLGKLVRNYGISVMILGLLIRLIMLPLSIKSARQSENMAKVKPEMNRLEKKYENKKDSASQMAKSQEMMLIYKKYNISPVSGCITAFIQLPLFFAFLEAINRVPAIFEGNFLVFPLGMTPWVGFSTGNYWYILLIILIIASTFFSLRKSMATLGGEAEKQMQFANKFMIIIISFASLRLPTAIALYWITTNGFAIFQNMIIKRSK